MAEYNTYFIRLMSQIIMQLAPRQNHDDLYTIFKTGLVKIKPDKSVVNQA